MIKYTIYVYLMIAILKVNNFMVRVLTSLQYSYIKSVQEVCDMRTYNSKAFKRREKVLDLVGKYKVRLANTLKNTLTDITK